MAQLGCSELTPPSQRFPTRMFKDEQTGGWRPYHTVKRKKNNVLASNGGAQAEAVDGVKAEGEYEFVEDPDSSEGAVYPIRGESCGCASIDTN